MKIIQSIVAQLTENEHRSEERLIVKYENEDHVDEFLAINKSSLTIDELEIYESFVQLINNKINLNGNI